jgi:hypothetical protein
MIQQECFYYVDAKVNFIDDARNNNQIERSMSLVQGPKWQHRNKPAIDMHIPTPASAMSLGEHITL